MQKDDADDFVSDIVQELRRTSAQNNQVQNQIKTLPLDKERLEDTIIEDINTVVKHTLEVIVDLKPRISAGAANDITAFSELIASFTSAVEAMNKINIADKNNKAKMDLKKMDIASKRELIAIESGATPSTEDTIRMSPEQLLRVINEAKSTIDKKDKQPVDNQVIDV